MSISKIDFSTPRYNVAFRADNVPPKQEETTAQTNPAPETDTEQPDHTVRNWSIGLGAAATLIGLGVLGYHGKLGKGLEKLLKGEKKFKAKYENTGHTGEAGNPKDSVIDTSSTPEPTELTGDTPNHIKWQVTNETAENSTAAGKTAGKGEKAGEQTTEKPTAAKGEDVPANQEIPKEPESVTAKPVQDERIVYVGERAKSSVPKDKITAMPAVFETDVEKLLKDGKVVTDSTGKHILDVKDVEGLYNRRYILNEKDGKYSIKEVFDFAPGESQPFRCITLKEDQEHLMIKGLTDYELSIGHCPTPERAAKNAVKEAEQKVLQEAYDKEMRAKLTPEAEKLIKDIETNWKDKTIKFDGLKKKADANGFSSLRGTPEIIDGKHYITYIDPHGIKYQYISRDGKTLEHIKVFSKDGKLSYRVNFSSMDNTSFSITTREGADYTFSRNSNVPELIEYSNMNLYNNATTDASEQLESLIIHDGKIQVNYTGNNKRGVNRSYFHLEK